MLTTLRIKNLALVADLTLELEAGYNVITGETGAGKSILIGALNLVLGERADRSLIRAGADSCSVEAVFDISSLHQRVKEFLEANGLEVAEDNQLFLKRAFTAGGANRQFINGSPATLNTLAALGQWLVDIHGPHEHQSLLHPSRQLAILDAFGGLGPERERFAAALARRTALLEEKAALIVDEQTYARRLELLRFQVNEISAARLQPGEAEQLDHDYRRAGNAARLLELSRASLGALAENDASLLTQAGALGRLLQDLQRLDPTAASIASLHEQAVALLADLQTALAHYADKIELDPARLRELEERLNLLQSLKRKYGSTVPEILAFGEDARRQLESLECRDAELARLDEALRKLGAELWRAGQDLSAKRRKLIPQLTKAAARELAQLGFKQSLFDVQFATRAQNPFSGSGDTPTPLPSPEGTGLRAEEQPAKLPPAGSRPAPRVTASGLDELEFLFAPNPGEPPHPLRAIASSGELARVMLALKTVLAAADDVPVLVFDEVDANVGGETALAVGEKMRQLARARQVLCITHLPQVAAAASAHFRAAKHLQAGRTISEISRLQPADRVTELARMLGGQTTAARKHAEALLQP